MHNSAKPIIVEIPISTIIVTGRQLRLEALKPSVVEYQAGNERPLSCR